MRTRISGGVAGVSGGPRPLCRFRFCLHEYFSLLKMSAMNSRAHKLAIRLLRFSCTVLLLLFSPVASVAQDCAISPKTVNLGETLRLMCSGEIASAKWNERTIRLFAQ